MKQPDHAHTERDTWVDADDERSPWRRRLPALVMLTALAGAVTAVWGHVLHEEATAARRPSCPPPPASANLTPVPYKALRGETPLPPSQVAVLVRNSTTTGGLAARVAARLELLGFAEAAPPDNDPVYPTGELRCTGQIRFGPDGRSAARTLNLVAPCARLVRDDRTDNTVDLVLGTSFTALSPTDEVRDVLRTLREQDQPTGGLQSKSGAAGPSPTSALADAPSARC